MKHERDNGLTHALIYPLVSHGQITQSTGRQANAEYTLSNAQTRRYAPPRSPPVKLTSNSLRRHPHHNCSHVRLVRSLMSDLKKWMVEPSMPESL